MSAVVTPPPQTTHRLSVLDNGVRVITETLPSTYSVSVGVWVDSGSRDEADDVAGISHFIEHMVFKGTGRRSALDIAKQIDRIGGMANAFTSKEHTCFHAKVLRDHLPVMVDLLADLFLASVFDPVEVDREKQVVIQEIKMVEDAPEEFIHVLFGRHFFDDNPLGRPVSGTIDTVAGLDRERLIRHMGDHYLPRRVVIAAAGAVEHDHFLDILRPLFAVLNQRPEPPRPLKPELRPSIEVYPRDLEQVHLCLGTLGPAVTDEDLYPTTLLNVILGGNMSSRLFQEVRENRGLAYSICSFLSSYVEIGSLGVYVAVDPATTHQTLEIIIEQLRGLLRGDIEAAELGAAKEHIKGSILLSAENSDNRMTRLARNLIHFDRYIPYETVIEKIEAVTPDDVQRVAEKFIRPRYLNLVVLGPIAKNAFNPTHLVL
ncbi:MAG: insulinase family protein [Proteobacteria bacterium]|nr:insulinase family protein [Pseudomonadota bacterium]